MNKIITGFIGFMLCMMITVLLVLCILTPEKTKNGEFTKPLKYWTDNQYVQENFK